MLKLKVELGARSYPVFIDRDILPKLGEALALYGLGPDVAVVSDARVDRLHGSTLEAGLREHGLRVENVVLPPGEKSKTWRTAESVITQLLRAGFERNACVLAFGGGVIGDLAGFVASVFKRGVALVHVPTTLLAQVDASIGGKTGVNHALGKNLIGTFHQPRLVWSDVRLLQTLPKREILCGLGEIVKYGVIKDTELFGVVEGELPRLLELDLELVEDVVQRCCEIKAEIVAADERDHGQRMVLNCGHTIGHALEAALNYKKISHGEAVLLGLLAESHIARELALLPPEDFDRIHRLVRGLELTDRLSGLNRTTFWQALKQDKKSERSTLRFALPVAIGEVRLQSVELPVVERAMAFLLHQH